MKGFRRVVHEIRATLISIIILPILLNAILIFLSFFIVLSFFQVIVWFSYIPPIAYIIIDFPKKYKTNKILLIEKHFPHLKEKLRTAADYANVDNDVIDTLQQEVVDELKNVRTSSFFDTKRFILKGFACVLLSFGIIFLTSLNLDMANVKFKIADTVRDIAEKTNIINLEDSDSKTSLQEGAANESGGKGGDRLFRNIFGEENVALLGNEEIEVKIKSSTFEFDISEIKEPEEREFENDFPEDVYIQTAETNVEQSIAKEHQQLVKDYFKNLAGG